MEGKINFTKQKICCKLQKQIKFKIQNSIPAFKRLK